MFGVSRLAPVKRGSKSWRASVLSWVSLIPTRCLFERSAQQGIQADGLRPPLNLSVGLPNHETVSMEFAKPRRRNPFDNFLVAAALHVCGLATVVVAVGWALAEHSTSPLWLGLALLSALEGMWLYFSFRR